MATMPIPDSGGPYVPDPYVPSSGTSSLVVEHYKLVIDYQTARNKLSGHCAITARTVANTQLLALDLVGLRASEVLINGVRARKLSHKAGKLCISLDRPLAAGTDLLLEIGYRGEPRPVRSLWGDIGWEELTDGALVASQPTGAPSWFPCNDHPSQKATYQFVVRVDAGYRVVCNGRQTEHHRESGRETWCFEQTEPMSTYLAAVHIGRYDLCRLAEVAGPSDRTDQNTVCQMWLASPPALTAAATAVLRGQDRMMAVFAAAFGPYPFGQYTVVVVDDDLEIPVEALSLSVFGRNHLARDWDCERLIAHELAHQWFGNSLTVGRWQDIWLHEGFACYAEWLWSEASGWHSVAQQAAAAWQRLSLQRQNIVVANPRPRGLFDDRVYDRGALAVHALRLRLGEDSFFRMLQSWTLRYRYGTVTTALFIDHASTHTDADVEQLLRPWLYEPELPDLPSSSAE